MRIAVIGARGFVGSSIFRYLSKNHSVVPVTRDTLNVLNPIEVKSFLGANLFDVIVNCAAIMTNNDSINDARNNFGMFMNFYDNKNIFGKFINSASGAEFDRSKDINKISERSIFDCMPQDSYGWGQNMKSRICADTDRFYNLRIFNCFGNGEPSTRIFPKFVRSQNQEEFIIENNRYFDYFGILDLCKVVEKYVENSNLPKDLNCVYEHKYKINEVLTKFCDLHNLKNNIKIVSTSDRNYTGNGSTLAKLNLSLDGLENSLKKYQI